MANSPNLLRTAAQATTVAAGVGSVALVWWVGRRNPSLFLMALFTLWVLSPLVALVIADRMSMHRSASSRATLHSLTLIVGIASVAAYLYVAAKPPRTTPASAFVIIPMASWGLIATVIPIAAFMSHRR